MVRDSGQRSICGQRLLTKLWLSVTITTDISLRVPTSILIIICLHPFSCVKKHPSSIILRPTHHLPHPTSPGTMFYGVNDSFQSGKHRRKHHLSIDLPAPPSCCVYTVQTDARRCGSVPYQRPRQSFNVFPRPHRTLLSLRRAVKAS